MCNCFDCDMAKHAGLLVWKRERKNTPNFLGACCACWGASLVFFFHQRQNRYRLKTHHHSPTPILHTYISTKPLPLTTSSMDLPPPPPRLPALGSGRGGGGRTSSGTAASALRKQALAGAHRSTTAGSHHIDALIEEEEGGAAAAADGQQPDHNCVVSEGKGRHSVQLRAWQDYWDERKVVEVPGR
jgi:hypothetical protein